MEADSYTLLADIVLIAHFAVVGFVVFGFLGILAGRWLNWRWIYNRFFRLTHLLLTATIAAQALLGQLCPLTTLESMLRRRADTEGYDQSFLQYWLHAILFFEAPLWIFSLIYTAFAAVVLLLWFSDHKQIAAGHPR